MIVFRCANGPVLWLVTERKRGITRRAMCVNDGTVVVLTPAPKEAFVAALRSMLSHSTTLSGALQETFEIDVDP